MPAFEKVLMDADTGEKFVARVSNFVVSKDGKLAAIVNTKAVCTKEAALAARTELQYFLKFIQLLQEANKNVPVYSKDDARNSKQKGEMNPSELTLDFDGIEIKILVVDVSKIELITIGPKGGKKFGFDRELDYTEKELKEAWKTFDQIKDKKP